MPSGRNWVVFVYINLAFVILISSVYGLLSINNIMNNWAEYRCDTLVMPFAGLIMQSTLPPGTTQSEYTKQNFQYCTQNVMNDSMGDFLQPLEYNSQLAATNASNMTDSLNSARQNSSNVRNSTNSIFNAMGNVFSNAKSTYSSVGAYNSSIGNKVTATGSIARGAGTSMMNSVKTLPNTTK